MSIVYRGELVDAIWGVHIQDEWLSWAIERLVYDDFSADIDDDRRIWEKCKEVIPPNETELLDALYERLSPDRLRWEEQKHNYEKWLDSQYKDRA